MNEATGYATLFALEAEANALALNGMIPPGMLARELRKIIDRSPLDVHHRNGVARFAIPHRKMTGEQWISRYEDAGLSVSEVAKMMLRSSEFQCGVEDPIHVAILKCSRAGNTPARIRALARRKGLVTPRADVVLSLRDALSDHDLRELGVDWLVGMHRPIALPEPLGPCLLFFGRTVVGAYPELSSGQDSQSISGYVFVDPQSLPDDRNDP